MKEGMGERIQKALLVKFPWGKDYFGKPLEEIPSPLLKWTAENWDRDAVIQEAADLVWRWREETGAHIYE